MIAKRNEKAAGIAILCLCIFVFLNNIFSYTVGSVFIDRGISMGFYTILMSYVLPGITILLTGIFALPFFRTKRILLTIPFGLRLLSVLLAGGNGYFFSYLLHLGVSYSASQIINRVAGVLFYIMMPICFLLFFGLKKNVTKITIFSISLSLFFGILSNILFFTLDKSIIILLIFSFFTIVSYIPFYLLILFIAPSSANDIQDESDAKLKYRSKTTAIILSVLLGGWGVDRFYLGYSGLGVVKLLTAGGFGVWSIIDLIMICTGSLKPADGYAYEETAANRSESNPPASQGKTDPAAEIKKLYELYQQGILTEEEYNSKKTALLERI